MWKRVQMGLRAFLLLASKVWTCFCYMLKKQTRAVSNKRLYALICYPASTCLVSSLLQLWMLEKFKNFDKITLRSFKSQLLVILMNLPDFFIHTHAHLSMARLRSSKPSFGTANFWHPDKFHLDSFNQNNLFQIIQHQSVKYNIYPLSPLSRHRLSKSVQACDPHNFVEFSGIVKRKVLVLDLDETLIHSHHDGVVRQTVKPGTPPDFVLKVVIDRHPVRFFVHKRPHVDFFLDIVSQWYDLVVFTASMEIYGAAVADRLDAGRGILQRRYYRQHCTPDLGSYTKDLSAICNDLSSIFILDNSPGAYRAYPDNAIPIKSWFSDPTDVALLNLLPVLDALRFTADVRSVLSRNLHLHRLW